LVPCRSDPTRQKLELAETLPIELHRFLQVFLLSPPHSERFHLLEANNFLVSATSWKKDPKDNTVRFKRQVNYVFLINDPTLQASYPESLDITEVQQYYYIENKINFRIAVYVRDHSDWRIDSCCLVISQDKENIRLMFCTTVNLGDNLGKILFFSSFFFAPIEYFLI
jgi:competence CoiA-like predicted nuclease